MNHTARLVAAVFAVLLLVLGFSQLGAASQPSLFLPPKESASFETSDAITTRVWVSNCVNWSSLGNTTQWQCWEWANTSRAGVPTYIFDIGQWGFNVTERDSLRLTTSMWLNTSLIRNLLSSIILDYDTPTATYNFNQQYLLNGSNATQADIASLKDELLDVGFVPQRGGGKKGGTWNATNSTSVGPKLYMDFEPLAKQRGRYKFGNHSINWTTSSTPDFTAGTLYQLSESGGNLTLDAGGGGTSAFVNDSITGNVGAFPTGWTHIRSDSGDQFNVSDTTGNNSTAVGAYAIRQMSVFSDNNPQYRKGWSRNYSIGTIDFRMNQSNLDNGPSDIRWALAEENATLSSNTNDLANTDPLWCNWGSSGVLTCSGTNSSTWALTSNVWYRFTFNWHASPSSVAITIVNATNTALNSTGAATANVGFQPAITNGLTVVQFTDANSDKRAYFLDEFNFTPNSTGDLRTIGSFQSPTNDTATQFNGGNATGLNWSISALVPTGARIDANISSSSDNVTFVNRSIITIAPNGAGNITAANIRDDNNDSISARYWRYNVTLVLGSSSTSPTLDSVVVQFTYRPSFETATWNKTWSNFGNMSNFSATTPQDMDGNASNSIRLWVGEGDSLSSVCGALPNVTLTANTTSNLSCVRTFPFSDNRNHTLTLSVEDIDGNRSSNRTLSVAADNEYPNGTLWFPLGNGVTPIYNWSATTMLVRGNLTDNRSSIARAWLQLNNSSNVTAVTTPVNNYNGTLATLNFGSEGLFYVRLWSEDQVGWVNETNATVRVDVPPALTNASAPSVAPGGTVNISVDVTENSSTVYQVLARVVTPGGGATNFTMSPPGGGAAGPNGTYSYAYLIQADGWGDYSVTFYANDTSTPAMNVTAALTWSICCLSGGAPQPPPTAAPAGGGGPGGGPPPAAAPTQVMPGPLRLTPTKISSSQWLLPGNLTPIWTWTIYSDKKLEECAATYPLQCTVLKSLIEAVPDRVVVHYTPTRIDSGNLSWVVVGEVSVLDTLGNRGAVSVTVSVWNTATFIPIMLPGPVFWGSEYLFAQQRAPTGQVVTLGVYWWWPLTAVGVSVGVVGGRAGMRRRAGVTRI